MTRSSSLHVLLLPSWYPATKDDVGGSFFREQAQMLCGAGVQVGVVAPRSLSLRHPSSWRQSDRAISVEEDEGVFTLRSTSIEWFGRVPKLGPKLWIDRGLRMFNRYVQDRGPPDVLHAHSLLNGGLLAREIAKRTSIPYVVTEHRTAYARGEIPGWKLELAKRAACDASDRIAVSEEFTHLLDKMLGGDQAPWRYIPNLVDDRFFSGPLAKAPSSGEQFQFCNIGMMTAKKGQIALIRAFADAFRNVPGVFLAFAGDGPLRPQLEACAAECGVAEKVRFAGRLNREQVIGLLRDSAAFVSSSETETFGVAVAEALAVGIPVVATRSGGPESIVRESDGLLVPNFDHAALVSALKYIHENRNQYCPARLRQGCAERYSGRAVIDQLIRVYGRSIDARTA